MEAEYLIVRFANIATYQRAVLFFDNESAFYCEESNDDSLSFRFAVSGDDDADATETDIEFELLREGFNSFWFESE